MGYKYPRILLPKDLINQGYLSEIEDTERLMANGLLNTFNHRKLAQFWREKYIF